MSALPSHADAGVDINFGRDRDRPPHAGLQQRFSTPTPSRAASMQHAPDAHDNPTSPAADSSYSGHDSTIESDEHLRWMSRSVPFPPVLPSASSSAQLNRFPEKLTRAHPRPHPPSAQVEVPLRPARSHAPVTSDQIPFEDSPHFNAAPPAYTDSGYASKPGDSFEKGAFPRHRESSPDRGPRAVIPTIMESIGSWEQDDASEESDMSSQRLFARRVQDKWTRVMDQRISITNTLDNFKGKRDTLLNLRQRRAGADALFMKALFEVLPKPAYDSLAHLHHQARDLDLQCQRAEDGVEGLINELYDGEVEMDMRERAFFSAVVQGSDGSDYEEHDEERDDDQVSVFTLRGIPAARAEETDPRFKLFQESIAKLELARERLFNLKLKKKYLEDMEDLSSDDREFLDLYENYNKSAVDRIEFWTGEASRLRQECQDNNLIPQQYRLKNDGLGFEDFEQEDIELGESEEDADRRQGGGPFPTLAHPLFPVLLSDPANLLAGPLPQTPEQFLRTGIALPNEGTSAAVRQFTVQKAQEQLSIQTLLTGIQSRTGRNSRQEQKPLSRQHLSAVEGPRPKSDFINRWLLHKLRLSAMEAEILYSTFQKFIKILDKTRWQRDVLYFWSRDGGYAFAPQLDGRYENLSAADTNINLKADVPSTPRSEPALGGEYFSSIGTWDAARSIPSCYPSYI